MQLGFDFVGINFYDGQGFMAKKSLGVKSALELKARRSAPRPAPPPSRTSPTSSCSNKMDYKVVSNMERE